MKIGMSLQDMAKELERQKTEKRDFIAPAKELEIEVFKDEVNPDFKLRVNGHGSFRIQETAHDQLSERLGIPRKYYERMKTQAPELLTRNANHWLHAQPEKRMIRTLDNEARAFLSSRYRPLDNFALAETVLPILLQNNVKIESSALTQKRLYIKAVTDKWSAEIKKGDIIQMGIVISNSEIGLGSVKVEPMIFRLICTNGMIAADHSLRKYHVGRSNGDYDLAQEFFTDDTLRADDKAFWMKVRDTVRGSFREDIFNKLVNRLRDSTEAEIVGAPEKVIEVMQEKYQLNDGERSGILKYLIKGGELTQYGLVNAITRFSQDVAEYDRATDLERLGGVVLELPKSDWEIISEAN